MLLSILLTSVSAFGAIAPGTAVAASGPGFNGLGTLSETAGVPVSITATLLDASDAPTSGSVTLTAPTGSFVGGGSSVTVTANVYGNFTAQFVDTTAGTVDISLSGSNGATGTETVNDSPAAASSVVLSLPTNVVVGGSTAISAVVDDVYSNPIPNASITFNVSNSSQPTETGSFGSGTTATATTSAQGAAASVSYTAPTQSTTVQFTATSGSLPTASGDLPVIAGTASSIVLSAPATASPGQTGITVSGTLEDSNGNGVGNASVTLTATEGGSPAGTFPSGSGNQITVSTSNTGTFSAQYDAPSAAGIVTFAATSGSANGQTTLSVTAGAPSVITMSPQTFTAGSTTTVSGTVTDASGNPVPSATVSFSVGGFAPLTTTTDSHGKYTVNYTAPHTAGPVSIIVTATTSAATASQRFSVTIAPDVVNTVKIAQMPLTAGQSYTLTGVVQDQYGNGIKGASVALSASAGTATTPVTTGTNGAFSFTYQAPTAVGSGQVTITATASYKSETPQTGAQTFTLSAGAPATITWNPVASTVRAGTPVTVSGVVTDANGNPVPSVTVSLTADYQAVSAGSFDNSSPQTDASGTFSATYTPPATAENVTLTAASNGAPSATLTLDVTGTMPATMALTESPQSGTAGQAQNLTVGVSLTDGAQNPVGDWPLQLTITPPSGPQVILNATTNGTGTYAWSLPFPSLAGTYTVEVAAVGASVSQTATFVVVPGQPASVTIFAPPTVTAGGKIKITGSVYDQYQNLVSAPASVTLQYNSRTVTVQTTNGAYSYNGFSAPHTSGGTVTVSATVASDTETATSQVVPGAPYAIALSPLGPLTAGTAGSLLQGTITDQYGNLITGSKSVSLSATAGTFPASGLPTDTVTALDGQFQDPYNAPTAAPQTVTITATEGSLPAATDSVLVTSGVATALTVSVPSSLRAGEDYPVTGTLKDSYGNPISGASVTLSLPATGDGSFGGSLTTTTTTDATGSYSATVTASQTAGAYVLTASAAGLHEPDVLNVTGATPMVMSPLQLTYTTPATAGIGGLQAQTTLSDQYGNLVNGWNVDLTVKTADGHTQTLTTTTGAGGIANFTLPMPTVAGTTNLTATPEGTAGLSQSASLDIVPSLPVSMTLVSQSGADIAAGSQYTVSGVVYDPYGNVVSGTPLTVTVTDGVSVQTITTTAGTYSAQFTAPTLAGTPIIMNASVAGAVATPLTLTVVPAAANAIALTSPPASLQADGQVTLKGTIEDQYGNPVQGTDTVTLTATSGTFSNSQSTIQVTATNGAFSAAYTAPSTSPQTVTLTADTGSLPTYSTDVSITGAPAASFTVQLPSVIRDGGSYTIQGAVYDQYGNGTSAPVTLTLQSGGGAFTGGVSTITATSGSDGSYSTPYAAPSGIGTEGSYTLAVQAASLTAQHDTLNVTGGTPTTMNPLGLTYTPTANQPTAGDGDVNVQTMLYDQYSNLVGSWPLTITVTDAKGVTTTYHQATGGFTSGAINYAIPMPTAAGNATITVSADGTALSQSATIDIQPAAPATLTLTGAPVAGNVAAGSSITLSGTVYDQYGNHVLQGIDVNLSSTAFTSPATVQTQADGTYSFQFTAPTTAGTTFSVAAAVSGAASPPALSYSVVPAAPYTFTLLGPSTVPAGNKVTIHGVVYDQYGNEVLAGMTNHLLVGSSHVTVQTLADGSYSYQFTAPTKAGTVVTVSGSVPGVTAANTPSPLQITVVNNIAHQIVLTLPATVQAGSQTNVTAYVYDAYGNTVGGQSTTIQADSGTLEAGSQNGPSLTLMSASDGSVQFTLDAPNTLSITPGTITVTGETKAGGKTIQTSATTTLVAADPATITLQGPASAGVSDSVKVWGYVHDAYQNPVSDAQVTVGGVTASTGADGYYTATITAPGTVGPFTATASVPSGKTTITAQTQIQIVAGAPAGLTLTAPGSMYTGGTVTVTGSVYDSGGNPVGGLTVNLSATEGGNPVGTISPTAQTDGNGDYSATFTAPGAAGTVQLNAMTSGLSQSATIDVTTAPPGPPGPPGPSGPPGPGGSPGPSGSGGGTPSTTPSPNVTIPPGGLLEIGGFTMNVSASAACSAVGSLTVASTSSAPSNLPQGFVAISGGYVLTGSALCTPQVATIAYQKSQVLNLPSQRIWIYEQTGSTWTYLPTTADPATGTASAYVSGPGTYIVLAASQQFNDVGEGYWAYGYIGSLLGAGIVSGFPDGTFRPDAVVTRAQFVKMLALALGVTPKLGAVPYQDVDQSSWYAPYVDAMYAQGALQSLAGTSFSPNQAMDREDVAAVLAAALKLTGTQTLHFTDLAKIAPADVPAVEAVVAAGYMAGFTNGSFQPLGSVTRAQASKILALLIGQEAP